MVVADRGAAVSLAGLLGPAGSIGSLLRQRVTRCVRVGRLTVRRNGLARSMCVERGPRAVVRVPAGRWLAPMGNSKSDARLTRCDDVFAFRVLLSSMID